MICSHCGLEQGGPTEAKVRVKMLSLGLGVVAMLPGRCWARNSIVCKMDRDIEEQERAAYLEGK